MTGLIGLLCALALGLLFYGAMVYQTPEGEADLPLTQAGGVLALSGAQLLSERTEEARYGGQTCKALVRTYQLESGAQAEAVSASPAAYLERLSREGYEPQLITGFTLAGMDAVYALRGGEGLLAARQGENVYMMIAQADEQTVYVLGAQAYLE